MTESALPTLDVHDALFLDFDGTLADLADRPDAVAIEAGLVDRLARLSKWLSGALAVISGREISQIDVHLAPLRLPAAGVHGVQRRSATGRTVHLAAPNLKEAEASLQAFASAHPGTFVESKRGAIALHYRLAPKFEAECREAMSAVASDLPGMTVMAGKMVFELKPAHANKGHAVDAFLSEPPFLGRRAIYAGDDVTDEDAIVAVQARGGIGIKVGRGPSAAKCRVAEPAALRAWLHGQSLVAARAAHG